VSSCGLVAIYYRPCSMPSPPGPCSALRGICNAARGASFSLIRKLRTKRAGACPSVDNQRLEHAKQEDSVRYGAVARNPRTRSSRDPILLIICRRNQGSNPPTEQGCNPPRTEQGSNPPPPHRLRSPSTEARIQSSLLSVSAITAGSLVPRPLPGATTTPRARHHAPAHTGLLNNSKDPLLPPTQGFNPARSPSYDCRIASAAAHAWCDDDPASEASCSGSYWMAVSPVEESITGQYLSIFGKSRVGRQMARALHTCRRHANRWGLAAPVHLLDLAMSVRTSTLLC
jgi:hypothetical protein